MDEREKDEIEIDLLQLVGVLWEKVGVIAGATIGSALIALLVTQFLMTPMYESTASVYVINRQGEVGSATSSDLSAATSLTYDFEHMVTTHRILEPAMKRVGLEMSVEELARRITVTNPSNTRILEITVEDEDPEMAKRIVDELSAIAAETIVEIMEIEKVNSIDEGLVADKPSSPSMKKNIAIGGMLGCLIASGLVVMQFILDDTIKTDEDIEKYLHLSVLGAIPDMENNKPARKRTGGLGKGKRRKRA